ncbi:transposase family protein [Streptomyces sp. VB1]|uniref:transposase family protein n=1 Tax=Streptomyces sp. VB1 TaxID=2986803 RepID=UPI002241AF7A|nr:transposase family protein [Streptomyces sp. VB1]UZI29443.1 transposase family protein [Streptomyces sp. VB1]
MDVDVDVELRELDGADCSPCDSKVPACVSSPIPAALDQLRDRPEAGDGEFAGLLERLAEVPEPRDPRGVRHRPTVVLALVACAVLSGATSLLAVGEWIADASPFVREQVPCRMVLGRSSSPSLSALGETSRFGG